MTPLHCNQNAKAMKKSILKSLVIFTVLSLLTACHSINRLPVKNKEHMFTVDQIKAAHSKVKSGADFPAYIKEIKQLGVTYYKTFVSDGHTEYYGASNFKTIAPAKYTKLTISETPNTEQFKVDLKEHQQGKTDFLTFIAMCA